MTLRTFNIEVTEIATGIISDCQLSVPSRKIALAFIKEIFNPDEYTIGEITEVKTLVHIEVTPYCPK